MQGMGYALEHLPTDAVRSLVNMVGPDAAAPLEEIALAVSQKKPIGAPPLLRQWTESGLPDFRWGVLRFKERSYRRSDALAYATIDDMLGNGQVRFALAMKQSPIRAVLRNERSWRVECEDDRMRKIVQGVMQHLFRRRAKDMLDCMPYGAMFFEKVFDRRNAAEWGIKDVRGDFYGYDDIKPIHPQSIKFIRYKDDGHTFDGFVQESSIGKEIPVKQEVALILTYDQMFRNLWGNPATEKMYPFWFWLELCWRAFLRYLERTGTPITIVEAPQHGTIIGPDDVEYGTMEYALLMAGYIMNSNAAAMPSDANPDSGEKLWNVRFLQDQARGDQFIKAIERLATGLTRSVVVGDMVGQQTEVGGYNQGQQHWEVTQLHNEEVIISLLDQLDRYAAKDIVVYNGSARTPPATLETQTLDPTHRARLFELFKIIGNQQGSEAFRTVNWRKVMDENQIPALTQDEIDKEFERELARQKERQDVLAPPDQQGGSPKPAPKRPGQTPRPPGRSSVRQSADYEAFKVSQGGMVPMLVTAEQAIEMLDRTVQDRPTVIDIPEIVVLNEFESWLEEWIDEMDDSEVDTFLSMDVDSAVAYLHDFMTVIQLQGPDARRRKRAARKETRQRKRAVRKETRQRERTARREERKRKRREWWNKVKAKIKEVAKKIWDKAKEVGSKIIVDALGRVWDPSEHPRDVLGRFVAKGTLVEEREEIHEDGSRTVQRRYVNKRGEVFHETVEYDTGGMKRSTTITRDVLAGEEPKRKERSPQDIERKETMVRKAWKKVADTMRELGIEISDEVMPENVDPVEFILSQRPGKIIRDLKEGRGIAVNFTESFITGLVADMYRGTDLSNFGIQLKDESFVLGSTVNFNGTVANVFLDGTAHVEDNRVNISLANVRIGSMDAPQILVRGLLYLAEKDYSGNEFLSNMDINHNLGTGEITITGDSRAIRAMSIQEGNVVVGLDPVYVLARLAEISSYLQFDMSMALEDDIDFQVDRILAEVLAEIDTSELSAAGVEKLKDYILGLLGVERNDLKRSLEYLEADAICLGKFGDFLKKAFNAAKRIVNKVVKKVTGKDLGEWRKTIFGTGGKKYAPTGGAVVVTRADGTTYVWNPEDHPRDPSGQWAEKGSAEEEVEPSEPPVKDVSSGPAPERPKSKYQDAFSLDKWMEDEEGRKTITVGGHQYSAVGEIEPELFAQIHETQLRIRDRAKEMGYEFQRETTPLVIINWDNKEAALADIQRTINEDATMEDLEAYLKETGGQAAHYCFGNKDTTIDARFARGAPEMFESVLYHETLHSQPREGEATAYRSLYYDPDEIFTTLLTMQYAEKYDLPAINGYPIWVSWAAQAAIEKGMSKQELYGYANKAHKADGGKEYEKLVDSLIAGTSVFKFSVDKEYKTTWDKRFIALESMWPGWKEEIRKVADLYEVDYDEMIKVLTREE